MNKDEQLDIISALSYDYLNVYAVWPENDTADVVKLAGYVTDDIKPDSRGVCYSKTLMDYAQTRVHPDDRKTFLRVTGREHIVKLMSVEEQYDFTYRVLVDGRTHYYAVRYIRVSHQGEALRLVVGFKNVDLIVEESRHNKDISEESEALSALHESLGSGNWSMRFDPDGEMIECNWSDKFRHMIGYVDETDFPNEMSAWSKLLHEEDRDRVLEAYWRTVRDYNGEHSYDVEYRLDTRDRGYRWFHAAGRVVRREDGTPKTFYGVFIDIDEQKRKDKALQDALIAAEHANHAKTVFLNNMSHDIRTPMNAIIGFTSLAATHADHPDLVREYLAKIQTSSNHLLSLINDVLDMSRIESGKVTIEEQEVNLPDVMHDLKTIVQADVVGKRLDFFIDTVDVVNEDIYCDKLRLSQVLINLLSNAMKFTHPGGYVGIRVTQRQGAPEGYASYCFEVKDNGIGISDEFLSHIFEPFEREQTTTVSGIPGTGLGLTITRNIVEMMGGTIDVESEQGKGTVFTVLLQFRTCGTPVSREPVPELKDMHALVVDDDFDTCASITKMLCSIGLRPDWTTSGKEAVLRAGLAIEQGDEYAVYIIDWLMPDMNGIEVVRRIRRRIGNSAPIIILTAYDWADIEEEAREAGVTAFCSKPIFLSELRELLEAPYKPHEAPELSFPDFSGKRVLLVEDNEMNREIAGEILEDAGFVVDIARDGQEAVDQVARSEPDSYAVILMDIQMPVMDGYEATKRIRAMDGGRSQVPIIATTADAFEEDRQNAIAAGMNGYIAKPIDIPSMMRLLQEQVSEEG